MARPGDSPVSGHSLQAQFAQTVQLLRAARGHSVSFVRLVSCPAMTRLYYLRPKPCVAECPSCGKASILTAYLDENPPGWPAGRLRLGPRKLLPWHVVIPSTGGYYNQVTHDDAYALDLASYCSLCSELRRGEVVSF